MSENKPQNPSESLNFRSKRLQHSVSSGFYKVTKYTFFVGWVHVGMTTQVTQVRLWY